MATRSTGTAALGVRILLAVSLLSSLPSSLPSCRGFGESRSYDRGAPRATYARSVGANPLDTLLLMPADLVAAGDTLYVLDEAGPDVRVLSTAGELVRVIGAGGRGPGELRAVQGIAASLGGSVAVSDPGSGRVSIFSGAGVLQGDFPVDGPLGAIEYDRDGHIHIDHAGRVGPGSRVPGGPTIGVYSSDGVLLRRYGSYDPLKDVRADYMNNQSRLARDPDGGMWVLYPYRGLVTKWSGEGELLLSFTLPPQEDLPTRGPFIREVDENTYSIVRVPIADDIAVEVVDGRAVRLHVLQMVVRRGELGARYGSDVHVFSVDGEPLGTYCLRDRAERISIADGFLYALMTGRTPDALPRIDVYELR